MTVPRASCNVLYYKPAWVLVLGLLVLSPLPAQIPSAQTLWPNLTDNIERPLRYTPDGEDFVITNGGEFFNRPLYGGNTAFRVDAGDRPEFVLYLPGRGGNLRLGLHSASGTKWLHDAAAIEARYRPGGMLYTIRDPLLGDGTLHVAAYATVATEALILRAEAVDVPAGLELIWAYGGVNGQRGRRDGDIGTETVPISEWFQLKPEFCAGNRFQTDGDGFILVAGLPRNQTATIRGVVPAGTAMRTGDAALWDAPGSLLTAVHARAPDHEVLTGRVALVAGTPLYLALQRTDAASATELDTYREVRVERADPGEPRSEQRAASTALQRDDLPALFAATEAHFAQLRGQVKVVTPDPYLNAAVGALNVAADAVWDELQGAVMHGAIAWRSKLLGWRGPYAMDALGWHDRARRHLAYWATRQNTDPIPDKFPPPEPETNLARSRRALHSNGNLSASHYDMNLVYIDALFRHLLWTGDLAFAREVWPVIERHLAWERRLFRREFEVNGEKLPLYEAYAAIWASDDLQYHGGGTAHASAYNYWHNYMASRLARKLGLDSTPYEREAYLIARGMRELLWTGTHFAEFKDYLGRQLVHPSAGLWTFYHTMDAGIPSEEWASLMAGQLPPAIPVRGPAVPTDRAYAVHASSDWLPYTWSLNNVVMGENIHTALGLWRAGKPEEAFTLAKGALLVSMFMGVCPGNVGSMNYLDVYRRESQRDFADGNGVTARAIIEGLFGLRPDGLARRLLITPGFPEAWDQAVINHPAASITFARHGAKDVYEIKVAAEQFDQWMLELPSRGQSCRLTVEGGNSERPFSYTPPEMPKVLSLGASTRLPARVTIEWIGTNGGLAHMVQANAGRLKNLPVSDSAAGKYIGEPYSLSDFFNDRVTEIFRSGKYVSPRSPFVSLAIPSQGIGAWAGHVNATAEIDDTGLRAASAAGGGKITLPNGVPFATPGPGDAANILFVSQWDNYPDEATVPLSGKARQVQLLMAGSTNAMQSRLDNGEVVVTYTDGTTTRLALRNPETWWPIEQDYFIDDYQFRVAAPLPTRVNLKTGEVRVLDHQTFKGQGRVIPGGAATVLALELDPNKELHSLTVRALANEVVIGLMAATLVR
ncbi:DUF4450 domain-containing protein [Oleiharenicola lentus]|uniref:DUF4450 domain-containing protein n=1 Tax=Oleiharenicola lentus TaxID=2508720 RepID=UPI0015D1AC23|nr:DUF4450 domain-containing protein [Oleiharenicola lentus]